MGTSTPQKHSGQDLAAAARKFESTVPYGSVFTGVPVVRFSGLRSARGLGWAGWLGDLVQQVQYMSL